MRKLVLGAAVVMSLVVVVVGAGCAAKPQMGGKASATAAAPADPSKKDVVHIVSRNRTVTVSSSSRGLLYSLKDADGRVQIADATEQRFAELEPELYQSIKRYVAVKNDDAPIPSASRGVAVPVGESDAPIPTADIRRDGPAIHSRTFRGGTSGTGVDQFNRTAERPFPTAREDAPE